MVRSPWLEPIRQLGWADRRRHKDEKRQQGVVEALGWLEMSWEEHRAAASHKFFAPVLQLAYLEHCSFWEAQYKYVSTLTAENDGQFNIENSGMNFQQVAEMWKMMKEEAGIE